MASKYAVGRFKNNRGSETFHPQLQLIYRAGNLQGAALVFTDSFGNPAGGLFGGAYLPLGQDFVTVGVMGGPYVRKSAPKGIHDAPIQARVKGVDLIAMAGLTASVRLPLGLEVNAMSTGVLTNISIGYRLGF